MVSKNQIKLIHSLQQKKFRITHKMFVAEGVKVIQELLNSNFELEYLLETEAVFPNLITDKKIQITVSDLNKMSSLSTPNNCLAVFKIPNAKPLIEKGLIVALDDIRDPGNLGTIIRLCDWFGIETLVCSEQTVDVYNPKVIQSTMGSISRVQCYYVDLHDFLSITQLPIYGTAMDGDNIYKSNLLQEGVLIMGNEANGISDKIFNLVQHRITIPRFGDLQQTESLNVATATAIVLSEFRR